MDQVLPIDSGNRDNGGRELNRSYIPAKTGMPGVREVTLENREVMNAFIESVEVEG